MAAFWGKEGSVSGWTFANITKWSFTTTRDIFDITPLDPTAAATSQWKEKLGGHKDWSGSFEGFIDDSSTFDVTDLDGAKVTLTLTDGTSTDYSGDAFITSVDFENDTQDVARFTCNFEGSGNITVTP